MDFSQALKALEQGSALTRAGWNGKDMFVFMQVPASISKEIVPKMQSLPDSVKRQFQKRFDTLSFQIDHIYYNNQFAIVNSSNMISGWIPSSADLLAKDWETLSEE